MKNGQSNLIWNHARVGSRNHIFANEVKPNKLQ